MAAPRRTLLGRAVSSVRRRHVYRSEWSLETDDHEMFDVRRTRLFFDEILLVTYHQKRNAAYLIVCALFTLLGGGIAVALMVAREWGWAAGLFAMVGAPFLILGLHHAVTGVDVVTVFGKRTATAMEFAFRKRRAREVYQLVCRLARESQERLAHELGGEPPTQAGT